MWWGIRSTYYVGILWVMFSISPGGNQIEQVWSDTVLDVHLGGMVLNMGRFIASRKKAAIWPLWNPPRKNSEL